MWFPFLIWIKVRNCLKVLPMWFVVLEPRLKKQKHEQFQMVDHFIPKTVARLAKDHGVESYQIISSLGASSSSKSFYLYVKGVVEETLDRFGFKRLVIYRPSLLEGNRQEFRFGEIIMSWLFRTFSFVIPDKYSPTNVESLARLMVSDLHRNEPGIHIVESTMIN